MKAADFENHPEDERADFERDLEEWLLSFTSDVVNSIKLGATNPGEPEEQMRRLALVAGANRGGASAGTVEMFSQPQASEAVARRACGPPRRHELRPDRGPFARASPGTFWKLETGAWWASLGAEDPWLVIGSPPCKASSSPQSSGCWRGSSSSDRKQLGAQVLPRFAVDAYAGPLLCTRASRRGDLLDPS